MQDPTSPKMAAPSGRWTPAAREPSRTRAGPTIVAAASVLLVAVVSAEAQTSACRLVADDRNPPEKILRCGDSLEVRAAHGTSYRPVDPQRTQPPRELQLDAGALMIEFHPSRERQTFQIRTPYAIAAVRGTNWVVEIGSGKTSTFVIAGSVAVSRPGAGPTALLRAREGADVSAGSGPIVVTRWAADRVRALLARFGQ
jgi:ferric-dicitrate binding protein FerR (iron transport regulator)